ncbi:FTS and Hook-interacting protein-like isoform X2 [Mizuhopecten yessoensis]|uniref:FTS and Hook-interacting protein-like isoform X2 n=1 Tax=Mizuhopecten yessoensis TaxID=6573 RepID=UPI000B45DAF1|nr:FTS and Hook-interacting protein-like isoform X2 [Mizuhopecten yessoensis]
MSWFKRGKSESRSSDHLSDNGSTSSGRSRTDTDPDTCLEVFKNHWTQAQIIITAKESNNIGKNHEPCTYDDVEAVVKNFEQMINLLASEDGLDENGQGMPGPILHYLLEQNVFESFCTWCQNQPEYTEKLKMEQLRMFEVLIGQSRQLLLIHKAVINPILRLLSSCVQDTHSRGIESRLVLILHQICASISQQTVILESFFNANADQGPAKFLIFSLLIPFIHREGTIGQQSRDSLLLIMTLSSKHPHIGEFIEKYSDFCPVLATGLSGLYSSLPRKIPVAAEDWFQITQDDINQVPGIQMFLNSLEFCNAVVQISHSSISEQLIEFIYKGFLVPVMGPALHQNSREEVIAATAYLELFLRKITEPALTRAFLKFILTEQNDEIVILESLVTRINSSTKLLCVVSLSLFKTLIDKNCEDVIFQLILRYLIPCTHVMVSQRRAVKDVDLYGKSAEKFLSLRPNCCVPDPSESPKASNSSPTAERCVGLGIASPTPALPPASRPKRGLGSFLRARKQEQEYQRTRRRAATSMETPKTVLSQANPKGSKLEHFETDYNDYLLEARKALGNTSRACKTWVYPYDGDMPSPTVFTDLDTPSSPDSVCDSSKNTTGLGDSVLDNTVGNNTTTGVLMLSHGNMSSTVFSDGSTPTGVTSPSITSRGTALVNRDFRSYLALIDMTSPDEERRTPFYQSEVSEILRQYDSSRYDAWSGSESEDVSDFLSYLTEVGTPPEYEQDRTIEDSILSLDSVLSELCSGASDSHLSNPLGETSENSSVFRNSLESQQSDNQMFRTPRPVSQSNDGTTFDVIDSKVMHMSEEVSDRSEEQPQDATSFVEITLSSFTSDTSAHDSLSKLTRTNSLTSMNTKENGCRSPPKSVSFSLPNPSMQMPTLSSGIIPVPSTDSHGKPTDTSPSIGPFLSSLFSKLEGMMQNNLSINLVLTGVIARLAAYPQPLLRSFLLNHNLVFQPTVKSLVQVLTSVRQKVDNYSYTLPNFEDLLLQARKNLATREENWKLGRNYSFLPQNVSTTPTTPKTSPINNVNIQIKEKKKLSLTDLLFRRSPVGTKRPIAAPRRGAPQMEMVPGRGYRYVHRQKLPEPVPSNPMDSSKTRNIVYCALILEEFVKELSSFSQEHSVLLRDEGYYSN